MNSYLQNLKQSYNKWAPLYDSSLNPAMTADNQHLPPWFREVKNKRVLDIACGTGRNLQKLLKQNNRIVGLDISSGMLAEAKIRLSKYEIQLLEADFLTSQVLHKSSFDFAMCCLSLEHFEDLSPFFNQAFALLKPGAELLISEVHEARKLENNKSSLGLPDLANKYGLQSHFHSAEHIQEMAAKAGFTLTKSTEVLGDTKLAAANSEWEKLVGKKLLQIWLFKKPNT